MLFSSIPFLYYFLPAVMGLYFLVPKGLKNTVLLVFSLLFYAWGEPRYVALMIFSILLFYGCGLAIGVSETLKGKKFWLTVSVVSSLSLLAIFKYADFFLSSVNEMTGLSLPMLKLALPIGISFYTFQCLSYTIDVYRGTVPVQKNVISFGAYVSLFPQLIAGPIVRYVDVARELDQRQTTGEDLAYGLRRFLVGLGKKVLLANQFGQFIEVFRSTTEPSTLFYWLYAVSFMLHIYFDFSGYSDMAIGLGRIFGFHFIENFDYPYLSKSVAEFWRRWHISLGSWFRDYVYIPMGGNRVSKGRWIFNIFTVWMLTGFWHGASWNFVLWGLYFALFLLLEKFVFRWQKHGNAFTVHLRRLYTLIVVWFGWFLFRFDDMGLMGHALKSLFGGYQGFNGDNAHYTLKSYLFILLVAMIACTPIIPFFAKKLTAAAEQESALGGLARAVTNTVAVAAPIALLILSALALVGDSYNPFLYFRF